MIVLLYLQDSVDKAELQHYEQLLETIGWFFFDLFILGYVEDPVTGHSFRFPCGMSWAIYIEVRTPVGSKLVRTFKFWAHSNDGNIIM